MKIRVQVSARVWLEFDCANPKDALKELSVYGEVFAERSCGQCKKVELAYEHREWDGHDYYSLRCLSCGAQLDFGQHKNGRTLFAKRKLKSGELDKLNHGWYHYKPGENRGDD